MEPEGAEMQRLAYLVMKFLREKTPYDLRWAKHGRAQGC